MKNLFITVSLVLLIVFNSVIAYAQGDTWSALVVERGDYLIYTAIVDMRISSEDIINNTKKTSSSECAGIVKINVTVEKTDALSVYVLSRIVDVEFTRCDDNETQKQVLLTIKSTGRDNLTEIPTSDWLVKVLLRVLREYVEQGIITKPFWLDYLSDIVFVSTDYFGSVNGQDYSSETRESPDGTVVTSRREIYITAKYVLGVLKQLSLSITTTYNTVYGKNSIAYRMGHLRSMVKLRFTGDFYLEKSTLIKTEIPLDKLTQIAVVMGIGGVIVGVFYSIYRKSLKAVPVKEKPREEYPPPPPPP